MSENDNSQIEVNSTDETKSTGVSFLEQVSIYPLLGYVLISPSLVFTVIYFNILGIPTLPTMKESAFFVGRTILATTTSIIPAIIIFALIATIVNALIKKAVHFLRNDNCLKESFKRIADFIEKNSYWINYLMISAFVIFLVIKRPGIMENVSKAFVTIFLIMSLVLFPIIVIVQANRLFVQFKRTNVINGDIGKGILNFIGTIVGLFLMITIISEGFIKDHMMFPQLESKKVRIWIDEKVEYAMSCNEDIGTVFIRNSILTVPQDDKSQGDKYEKQVNIIDTDIAADICSRIFGTKRL